MRTIVCLFLSLWVPADGQAPSAVARPPNREAFLTITSCGPAPRVEDPPLVASVRRLHGIIHKNQIWSGLIIITDDLTIQEATVTIAAGTTIEFAHEGGGHHPRLIVGPADGPGGYLKLQATAERPITFRTRPDTNPGHLVINVRSRIVPARKEGANPLKLTRSERVPNHVAWQHVRFEDLGHVSAKRLRGRNTSVAHPAVTFNVVGAAHSLGVANCTFERTTRLLIRAADGARITVASDRFQAPRERASLEILGHEGAAPAGPIAVTRNTLAAAISVRAAPATITDNVLIGLDAAIVVEPDAAAPGPPTPVRGPAQTRIADNYVHNTTKKDDGRYCLKCEDPAALIEDNIFRGGTTCVWSGSRRMSGNVFIAAPRLASDYVKTARTHRLVNALPPGATFERNLLLGPAYSLIIPQPLPLARPREESAGPTLIRHNLFDGVSDSARAIHLNPIGRPPVTVAVLNNVFMRTATLVFDEGRTDETLTYADYNAVAPPAARAFDRAKVRGADRGNPGWSAKDVECKTVASLFLTAAPPPRLPDDDADRLVGKIGVRRLRERLFDAYRPLPHSPLVHAGRPRNPDAAAPSIGPREPVDK